VTALVSMTAPATSYTRYLLLADHFSTPAGGAIWFTSDARFEGRAHTNTEFRFTGQPYSATR
jgi:hypothetical protein